MMMQYNLNTFLPSDHIGILLQDRFFLCNHAGKDLFPIPNSIKLFFKTYRKDGYSMLFFSINEHYPEVKSAYYQNAEQIARIQIALSDRNLFFVEEDHYRSSGFVPHVFPGALLDENRYFLIDASNTWLGPVSLWTDMGTANPFFHDNRILALLADTAMVKGIKNIIMERIPSEHICDLSSV